MTAGLAVGYTRGLELEAVLRLAAAAELLNVTRHGLGSGRHDGIEAIARRIELGPLSR
jgi:1-phosphofructokinase